MIRVIKVERHPAICEVCEAIEKRLGDFVTCEGFLVCEACAKQYGLTLGRIRDELDDELRRS